MGTELTTRCRPTRAAARINQLKRQQLLGFARSRSSSSSPRSSPYAAQQHTSSQASSGVRERERKTPANMAKEKLTKSGKKRKEKDPEAPKRAKTAYIFFLDAFRAEFKEKNPDAKGVVEVTKAGSQRWKSMTDAEKSPFEEKAAVAREAYQKVKYKYDQGVKLTKGPPRPPSAYFVFLDGFRAEYKRNHPDTKGIKELSKEAGEKWRAMDDSAKSPFEAKAAAAKEYYQKLKELSAEERVAILNSCNDKPYAKFYE